MSNDIVGKFLQSENKKIFTYCKDLSKIISLKDKNIFGSTEEFNNILQQVIKIYIDKYFFLSKINFSLLSQYYSYTNENNIIFNKAYLSIIDYYNSNNISFESNEYSFSMFYLIALFGFSFELDSNVNSKKVIEKEIYRNIINGFINIMLKNSNYKINLNYKKLVDILCNKLIKNQTNISLFFETVRSEKAFNQYKYIEHTGRVINVNFAYNDESLSQINLGELNKVINVNDINNNFTFMSYEIVCTLLLKLFINKVYDKYFIINVDKPFLLKESHIKKLDKIASNNIIKKRIFICINYKDIKDKDTVVDEYINMGFKVVINFNDDVGEDIINAMNKDVYKLVSKNLIQKITGNNILYKFDGKQILEKELFIKEVK